MHSLSVNSRAILECLW